MRFAPAAFAAVVIGCAPRGGASPAAPRPGLNAQMQQPMLGEAVVRISDHVWAIMGFPNVGIVVGTRAVLVVDTGLGDTNGATAARVAARLAPTGAKMFLTTTHFHPEHTSGAGGFPSGTILIRNSEQQEELEHQGAAVNDVFRGLSVRKQSVAGGKYAAPARHRVRPRSKPRSRRRPLPFGCRGSVLDTRKGTSSPSCSPIGR